MLKTLDLVVCHCSQLVAWCCIITNEARTKICPLGLLINIRPIVILYKYRSVKRYLFSNCLYSLRLEGTQSICGVTLFYWQRNNDMCYNWNMQSLATIWSIYQYRNHNWQYVYKIITRNMEIMMTRIITNTDETGNFPESEQKLLYPLLTENQCFCLPALISC